MANLPTDMELELAESHRNATRTPSPQLTPCEQLKYSKAQLAKMEAFRRCKQACVDALMMMPDHHPDEPFYVRALTELHDIEETMALAERNFQLRISPQRKTARKVILENTDNEEINLSQNKFELPQGTHFNNLENSGPVANENPNGSNNSASQNTPQNQLPPPIMLFVEKNYKAQMAAITKAFPKIRSRLTGEFLKLYTDSAEERLMAVQHLKLLKFQFYTIKSKAERPIKVVIKGLPRNTNQEEIKQDLEILGFTPDRVNQLIGRKNKRPLPIFLITLPRNLDNLKIFDLKTLNYLSIRVEGYDGRGVTQCYTCNNFNHSSENCHLNPRCLKCGENHLTRDCPIKQKLETPYCGINCNIYGHMANYRGCPSFPKPPKGAAKNNRNSYTNIYNSLVRPNISYAQATTGAINSKNTPQMATRGPGSSAQTETNKPIPPNNRYNKNHFPNFNRRNNNFNFNNMNNNNYINIQTTLQMTMHCLMQLSQILCNDNWKEAIIFPIKKPGKDPHLASSYRPISLLSTIGKLTESIILHRLKNFINENNILNPNQYGFTNKLSTLHPLLRRTENISEGFQKKKSTGAVFLHIQKAFDRVWINGLTFKLITFKIPHPLIHLIHSYLTNRSFRIRINETLSNEHSVSAGCPQGSLLGPLLFNLYINDIPDYSLTKINLYADDTAIHATYKNLKTISFALNKHLLLLQNFYDKWKISINVEKSTAIIFTKKQSLPPPIIMYNTQIPWSQEAKYLGIIFDTHLT
ncbi:probable RNA-directed DNA polymerase from transposon X-element [Trichonephila clavipes]|nr:probable RNA-directed DNA polymerase from transposon X-element [Trichonephila clavipes]